MASPHPLRDLRARIAAVTQSAARAAGGVVPVTRGIDAVLPGGGLARGAVHEILGAVSEGSCLGEDMAAAGFCAALAAGLASGDRLVLWCVNSGARGRHGLAAAPYLPGLAAYGIRSDGLILVRARRDAEALWVVEEALRAPALGAVVAEVAALGLTESRRLQLAAETGGATALLLRPADARLQPTAAATRWRVAALPGSGSGSDGPGLRSCWRIELLRCRGGRPGMWNVMWQGSAAGFAADSDAVPDAGTRLARTG